MTPHEILTDVRVLLSESERWTKGAYARDASGGSTEEDCDPKAVCWCLLGAVGKIATHTSYKTSSQAFRFMQQAILQVTDQGCRIADFNDAPATTHADILRVLDKAVQLSAEG